MLGELGWICLLGTRIEGLICQRKGPAGSWDSLMFVFCNMLLRLVMCSRVYIR